MDQSPARNFLQTNGRIEAPLLAPRLATSEPLEARESELTALAPLAIQGAFDRAIRVPNHMKARIQTVTGIRLTEYLLNAGYAGRRLANRVIASIDSIFS